MNSSRVIQIKGIRTPAVLVFTAFLCTLPIYLNGITSGNDFHQHYQFASVFFENLRNGTLVPSWSGASNFGFGDVGVRFYPPLTYYTLSILRLAIGNWYDASVAAIFFWFALGSIGTFLLAREWFDEASALVAGVAFAIMPYHVNQIYNAFLLAEFAGTAILPFCFLFVSRVCRRRSLLDIIGLTLSISALVLTHLPLTVIGLFSLAVFAICSFRRADLTKTISKLAVSVVISLAVTSFYWVRLMVELDQVNHSFEEYRSGAFAYQANFLFGYFSLPNGAYAETSLWFVDLLGLFSIIMFAPAAILFFVSRSYRTKQSVRTIAAVLIASVFLATPLSDYVWKHVTFLQRTQFPWRWLTVISLCGAVLIGSAVRPLAQCFRTRRPLVMAAVGLAVVSVSFVFAQVIRPASFTSRPEFEAAVAKLPSEPSCDCWWPRGTQSTAFSNRVPVYAGDRHVELVEWTPTTRSFNVSGGESPTARVATFYYPNWIAIVNGRPAQLSSSSDGVINLTLPEGPAEIKLRFVEDGYTFYTSMISIISLGLLFAAAVFSLASRPGGLVKQSSEERFVEMT